jgi:hypothetical protein
MVYPQADITESVCTICERVAFGKIVPLGFDKWRHEGCALGSKEWKEYYLRLAENERKPLRAFYNHTYEANI